ncbi:MAG: hypothetical protein ABW122_05415 [Ilumatobacteraceae bacterium]
MSEGQSFPFTFATPMRWLATLFGGRHAHVTVTDDALAVRYGVMFSIDVPVPAIRAATRTESTWWWGIGVHGWKHTWVANGSLRDLVRLTLDPEQRGRTLGIPVRVRELIVSVQEPDAFIAAVGTAADRR